MDQRPADRRLFFAATLAVGAVLVIGALSWLANRSHAAATERVVHTERVIRRLNDALACVQEINGGSRGFVLTGDDRLLMQYRGAAAQLPIRLASVKALTQDNELQQRAIEKLDRLLQEKVAFVDELVATRQAAGADVASLLLANEQTFRRNAEIRQLIDAMQEHERDLLAQRTETQSRRSAASEAFTVGGFVLAAAGMIWAVMLVRRHMAERVRAERDLAALNERLDTKVRERTAELDLVNRSLADEAAQHQVSQGRLQSSEDRYRLLIQNFPNGAVLLFDRDLRYSVADGQGLTLLGVTREDIEGRTVREAFGPRTAGSLEPIYRAALEGRATVTEVPRENRLLRVSTHPVRDSLEHITGGLSIVQDVTAARELEERLKQAQKMESMGQLAGGIAHDFGNLLFVIQGSIEIAARDVEQDGPVAGALSTAQVAVESGVKLIRQLLAVSQKQSLRPTLVDLGEVAMRMGNIISRALGSRISVDTRLHDHLPRIRADVGQMEQIFLNLAINARDAMREGGVLSIGTGVETVSREKAAALGISTGDYVTLSFTDTGHGFDQSIKSRIFEPFFTTKDAGKGSGLGLSTVYGIVQQSGGGIFVESSPGKGAHFRVYLPVAAPYIAPDHPAVPAPPARAARVLVVDDEPLVRDLVIATLQMAGYSVTAANDGAHALHLVDTKDMRLDLLVTDWVMPGMNGRQLAERILARQPGLAVLFMSGYVPEGIDQHQLSPNERFLQKPFRTDDLLGAAGALVGSYTPRRAES